MIQLCLPQAVCCLTVAGGRVCDLSNEFHVMGSLLHLLCCKSSPLAGRDEYYITFHTGGSKTLSESLIDGTS